MVVQGRPLPEEEKQMETPWYFNEIFPKDHTDLSWLPDRYNFCSFSPSVRAKANIRFDLSEQIGLSVHSVSPIFVGWIPIRLTGLLCVLGLMSKLMMMVGVNIGRHVTFLRF
jgi:hypothetical protein